MSKSYTPTGFPVGRPRNGEIRPVTAKNEYDRAYYEATKEEMREVRRQRTAAWRAKDPQRARQLAQASRLRTAAYAKWVAENDGEITVTVTITQ